MIAAATLVLALAATPDLGADAPAPPLAVASEPRAELLVDLVEENGCRMTGEEAGEILPRHGFTKDETQEITAELFGDGRIRIDRDTDTLILMTRDCR